MKKYTKETSRLMELAGLKNSTNDIFDDIYSHIAHATDGPVSKYVAITRALELAKKSTYHTDDIAAVLIDVLDYIDEDGDIPSNEY